jgi:invasion protein IalB
MSIHSLRTSLITAIIICFVTAPLQLAAQEKVAAQEKAVGYKDWGYKCEKPEGIDQEICYLFQRVTNKENNKRISDITVAYPQNGDKPIMVITLPLGVYLPAGIQLKIDEGEEVARAPYIVCIQNGCQARVTLEDKLIGTMKGGKMLRVAFFTPQQKELAFPVSLSGFTAAIGALKK